MHVISRTSTEERLATEISSSAETDYFEQTTVAPYSASSISSTVEPELPGSTEKTETTHGHESTIDISLFHEPSADIYLSKEGNNVRVEWDLPEDTICDAFVLKYTILSLSTPKTYSVGTDTQYSIIKMFPEHKLQVIKFDLIK